MDARRIRMALGFFGGALVALAGCSHRSGSLTPFPTSQTHIYVFNAAPSGGSIEGFPIAASGNVAPSTKIYGTSTGLDAPYFGTVNSSGSIYAPNTSAASITTYISGSNGDVGPTSDLTGSYTGLGGPAGVGIASSGNFYVCNAATGSAYTSVTEYTAGSTGNVAPIATIHGPATDLDVPYDVALDSLNYIYVSNGRSSSGNGSVTVFAPNSNGNVAPARLIAGEATGLDEPTGVALDASGNLYVSNRAGDSVTIYAAGANGNVAPSRTIAGSNTKLNDPGGIAVDSSGNIYVANEATPSITIYAASATGNVAPIRTITGSSTGLDQPFGVGLY